MHKLCLWSFPCRTAGVVVWVCLVLCPISPHCIGPIWNRWAEVLFLSPQPPSVVVMTHKYRQNELEYLCSEGEWGTHTHTHTHTHFRIEKSSLYQASISQPFISGPWLSAWRTIGILKTLGWLWHWSQISTQQSSFWLLQPWAGCDTDHRSAHNSHLSGFYTPGLVVALITDQGQNSKSIYMSADLGSVLPFKS
jgi:hypothetical protein